jgi:hypothetical protein
MFGIVIWTKSCLKKLILVRIDFLYLYEAQITLLSFSQNVIVAQKISLRGMKYRPIHH